MGVHAQNVVMGVINIVDASNISITHNIITDNHTQGGGIYINTNDGETTSVINITDNVISDNEAGGVTVVNASGSTTEHITVARNTFSNCAESINFNNTGGTISDITIEDNTISNSTDVAGIFFSNETSAVLSQDITIRNNRVTGTNGDGIFVQTTAGTIDNLTITGNTSSDNVFGGFHGNGIGLVAQSNGIISNATISGNTVTGNTFAGLYFILDNEGTSLSCKVSGNTVKNNETHGIYVCTDTGELVVDAGSELGASGYNSIYGNTQYDATSEGAAAAVIQAKYNWWGQSPPNPDKISLGVNYTPWLTSNPN